MTRLLRSPLHWLASRRVALLSVAAALRSLTPRSGN
jgi:hypothetical protein